MVVDKAHQLPKRSATGGAGYDALASLVGDFVIDGTADLVTTPPAPQPGDINNYGSMSARLGHIYTTRFENL